MVDVLVMLMILFLFRKVWRNIGIPLVICWCLSLFADLVHRLLGVLSGNRRILTLLFLTLFSFPYAISPPLQSSLPSLLPVVRLVSSPQVASSPVGFLVFCWWGGCHRILTERISLLQLFLPYFSIIVWCWQCSFSSRIPIAPASGEIDVLRGPVDVRVVFLQPWHSQYCVVASNLGNIKLDHLQMMLKIHWYWSRFLP